MYISKYVVQYLLRIHSRTREFGKKKKKRQDLTRRRQVIITAFDTQTFTKSSYYSPIRTYMPLNACLCTYVTTYMLIAAVPYRVAIYKIYAGTYLSSLTHLCYIHEDLGRPWIDRHAATGPGPPRLFGLHSEIGSQSTTNDPANITQSRRYVVCM